MNRSPALSGPQPLSSQQKSLILLITVLLAVILLASAYLSVSGAQGADLARLLLPLVFVSGLLLALCTAFLMRVSMHRDNPEFVKAYQSLQAQVLERKTSEERLQAQNEYFGA